MSASWRTAPRLPLELLDDANLRGTPLPTLRELCAWWLDLRPTEAIPKTVSELSEVLVE
jgi:hypothetical protein